MDKSIYSTNYKKLAEKLKQARLDSKLDQISIAEKLGKTQSYISKIESGQIRLDVIQLKEIAEIYKKPIDYFI